MTGEKRDAYIREEVKGRRNGPMHSGKENNIRV